MFHLTALDPVLILGPLGRPAQAWFLGMLSRVDGKLAAELHEANGVRPYTVSTLLDDRGYPLRANQRLTTGQDCWLRVTAFRDDLSEILSGKMARALPKQVTLYKMPFRLDGYTLNRFEHPWAGEMTWQELIEMPVEVQTRRDVRIEFLTPTAFRDQGKDLPLPLPGSVFRSLYERWNSFTPPALHLHDSWPEFARDCIIIEELTAVNSDRWVFAEGSHGAATGFTGTVGFQLLAQRHAGDWAEQWHGASGVVQALARFAFFTGIGHHTSIGMGQARLLT